MNPLTKFFTSVKLALVLIIVLILASVLGTLIPQDGSAQDYAARYGRMAGVLIRLQVTHLYHSVWYLALLLLLGLNITVCTLSRLSSKWARAVRPDIQFEAAGLLALKTSDSLKRPGKIEDGLQAVRRELGLRHYRLREAAHHNRRQVLARKRILGWFGSDLVHLGLLIILAGGILSGWTGSRGFLQLEEGQSSAVPRSDFRVRLDKFQTELYPQGSVKSWKSTVTVIEGGRDVFSRVVRVNHPLSHRGVRLYQSGYGWDWTNPSLDLWVKKKSDPAFLEKRRMRPGEQVALPGGLELKAGRFVPDFIMGRERRVESRSDEPRNPAALVEIVKGSETMLSGWVFANYPDFGGMHSGPGADFSVELKDAQAPQYSVLEAARDPGAAVIWLACILIMAGLFLAFYWPPREIRIILEENRGKTEIAAGGLASKNRESFESEFQDILSSIRRGA